MSTRMWWGIIVFLLIVIAVMAWFLFATPAPAQTPVTSTSTPVTSTTTPDEPLHTRVVVSSPATGATVGQSFTVSGEAPGNWYNEAVFPIKVVDMTGDTVGHGQGQAQGDWMTTAQVPFIAAVTLDSVYHGSATLVLLKDNESGLPQNDDSLEIPIVIQ